jgi:hypothetical protein
MIEILTYLTGNSCLIDVLRCLCNNPNTYKLGKSYPIVKDYGCRYNLLNTWPSPVELIVQKEIRMSGNTRSTGILLGSLLIGAVVGAVAALLVAPQPGFKTRTMIKEKGSEVKDKIVYGAGETKIKAQQAVVGMRDRVGKWVRGLRRMDSGYEDVDLEIINPEISHSLLGRGQA